MEAGIGGVAGSLVSKGVAESDAQEIENTVKNGGVLLVIDSDAGDKIESILGETNPTRIVQLA